MEVHCEICDTVVCVGRDQSDGGMARHIQGKRHQRLLQVKKEVSEKASCSIFVRGYQGNTKLDAASLKVYFKKFGSVKKIAMDRFKSLYAIIEFHNKTTAQQVLGQSDHRLPGDQRLVVKPREVKLDKFKASRPSGPKKGPDIDVNPVEKEKLLAELRTIGSFDGQMERLMSLLQLSFEDTQQRSQLCHSLQQQLAVFFPGCTIHQFGSSVNRFGVKGCDMDLFLDLHIEDSDDLHLEKEGDEDRNQTSGVEQQTVGDTVTLPTIIQTRENRAPKAYTREELKKMTTFDQVKAIRRSVQRHIQECQDVVFVASQRCPVCRFTFRSSGLKCDISVNNRLALRNTEFLRLCTELDPRISPLVYSVRYWAKCREIAGNIQSGTKLNNYALCMLVVFYLQNLERPVLPSIQQLADNCSDDEKVVIDGWDCSFVEDQSRIPSTDNTMLLGELFLGFFRFYSTFDFSTNVICPRTGTSLALMNVLNPETQPPSMEGFRVETLAIQDPFVLNHNPALNINEKMKERIISEFQSAAKMADFIQGNPDHEFSHQGLVLFLSNEIPSQFIVAPNTLGEHAITKVKAAETKFLSKHGGKNQSQSCYEASFDIVLCPAHLSQESLSRLNEAPDFKDAWMQEVCHFIKKILTDCLLFSVEVLEDNSLQASRQSGDGFSDLPTDESYRGDSEPSLDGGGESAVVSAVASPPAGNMDIQESVKNMGWNDENKDLYSDEGRNARKSVLQEDITLDKTGSVVSTPLADCHIEDGISSGIVNSSCTPKRQNSGSENFSELQVSKKTKSESSVNSGGDSLSQDADSVCADVMDISIRKTCGEKNVESAKFNVLLDQDDGMDCGSTAGPAATNCRLYPKTEEGAHESRLNNNTKQLSDNSFSKSLEIPGHLLQHLKCTVCHKVWHKRKAIRKNLLHAGHEDDFKLESKITQGVMEQPRDSRETGFPFDIEVLLVGDDSNVSQTSVHVILRAEADKASHSFGFFSSYLSKTVQKYLT